MLSKTWLTLAGSALVAGSALAQGSPAMRVCLPEDSAPYSWVERGHGRGFDMEILEAASRQIGRSFEPVWFESRYDKEGNGSLDARALLAAGVCDLVAGIPLYEPQLAPMIAEKARTPDYPGAKPLRQRPWQTLVPVEGGAPYRAASLALIARDGRDASVSEFAALRDRPVAVRAGSMASLALGSWHNGAIASSIKGYNVREDVLGALDLGKADFALVDVAVWDRYRLGHPETPLRRAELDYPVKINIGLLARASDGALLHDVETAIRAVQAGASLSTAAGRHGVTWIAPVIPIVRPVLTVRDFVLAGG